MSIFYQSHSVAVAQEHIKHAGQGVPTIRTEQPWTGDTMISRNENQHDHKLLMVAKVQSDIVLCIRDTTSGSGMTNSSPDSSADGSCSFLFFICL